MQVHSKFHHTDELEQADFEVTPEVGFQRLIFFEFCVRAHIQPIIG